MSTESQTGASHTQLARMQACHEFLAQAHQILDREGPTPSALHELKIALTALGQRRELFPPEDFPMPRSGGRLHTLVAESNDGLGLHLLIANPGKMSNPHSHSIWCINASISGSERHVLWRRQDDGSVPGQARVERVGEVIMSPGHGFAMADHDIHSQEVIGDQPSVMLALYGHTFDRFPSVVWYHPEFNTLRKLPSRRGRNAA